MWNQRIKKSMRLTWCVYVVTGVHVYVQLLSVVQQHRLILILTHKVCVMVCVRACVRVCNVALSSFRQGQWRCYNHSSMEKHCAGLRRKRKQLADIDRKLDVLNISSSHVLTAATSENRHTNFFSYKWVAAHNKQNLSVNTTSISIFLWKLACNSWVKH